MTERGIERDVGGTRLVTTRLLLRRWLPRDREPFAAMNSDDDVMRYFPAPLDRVASDRMIDRIERHFDSHGWGLWAVEVRSTGDFIGFTGLAPMPEGMPGEGGVEIGWRLASNAWGVGYATEAASAVRDFAFEVLGLRALWSLTASVNLPSIALMRRIGMRWVATQDHPRVPAGHLREHVVYRLDSPQPRVRPDPRASDSRPHGR